MKSRQRPQFARAAFPYPATGTRPALPRSTVWTASASSPTNDLRPAERQTRQSACARRRADWLQLAQVFARLGVEDDARTSRPAAFAQGGSRRFEPRAAPLAADGVECLLGTQLTACGGRQRHFAMQERGEVRAEALLIATAELRTRARSTSTPQAFFPMSTASLSTSASKLRSRTSMPRATSPGPIASRTWPTTRRGLSRAICSFLPLHAIEDRLRDGPVVYLSRS